MSEVSSKPIDLPREAEDLLTQSLKQYGRAFDNILEVLRRFDRRLDELGVKVTKSPAEDLQAVADLALAIPPAIHGIEDSIATLQKRVAALEQERAVGRRGTLDELAAAARPQSH